MDIAYTEKFKTGKWEGRSPADILLQAQDKEKAVSDLKGQYDYLKARLSGRYKEDNQKVMNAIMSAINLFEAGDLTPPGEQSARKESAHPNAKSVSPKEEDMAYSVKFSSGPYANRSPADVILSASDENKEAVLQDFRSQFKLLSASDDNTDRRLAKAIRVAGILHKNGNLRHPQTRGSASSSPNSQSETIQQQGQKKTSSMQTMKDNLRQGSIMVSYDSTYLCNVAPAFGIHKMRWSIVELKTEGKNHLDFYMNLDDFRRFCDEIDSGIARKKFSQDMEKSQPEAYRFITGENGCKHLNIGGGRKGIRVNISIKDAGYASAIVPFNSLKDMSFYFKLVSGLTPVTQYYGELVKEYWIGEEERLSYYQE